ncbi:MAG: phosphotransferase [Nitrospirae bacterium]|nr:phosphotransferase [Nitrospirota bacterium]
MNSKLNCFILAAGRGERLMPITSYLPKPLLPVAGRPVIKIILDKISELKPASIGINTHHLSEKISELINKSGKSNDILLFHETKLLDTGGALKNASSILSQGIFLVHNGDIITDIDLQSLVSHHKNSGNMATLAVHDFDRFNNVLIDSEYGYVGIKDRSAESNEFRSAAFTGIAVYNPEFLDYIPEGASSVVDAWSASVSDGKKVGVMDFSGCRWTDIGTPSAYAASVADALINSGETVYLSSRSKGCQNASIKGLLSIEDGVVIEPDVELQNCIVMPNTILKPGVYKDCIIVNDKIIDLGSGFFSRPCTSYGVLIGSGGSDRNYYRTISNDSSRILMVCSKGDPDFERHIKYTAFFSKHKIPVPEFIGTGQHEWSAFFEDLGDVSLYSWMKCKRGTGEVENIYKKALDIAVSIHSIDTAEANLITRQFDLEHFSWETSYFLERFVKGYCCFDPDDEVALEKEFAALAAHTGAFKKCVIHRDFQSQNIMIKDNTPSVIDFQGARIGPAAYDIASILWDPYTELSCLLRNRMLDYYVYARKKLDNSFSSEEFSSSLLYCRLQRHMQALGAYAFLSEVKGKSFFQKHMPACLSLLVLDIEESRGEFPHLAALIKQLHSLLREKNIEN